MRLGTMAGRAVLVADRTYVDVEEVSGRRFPADPVGVLERWAEFRAWVEGRPDLPGWAPLPDGALGPPVPHPRQVFALAVNYVDHAAEAAATVPEFPLVFGKFPSCITGPYDDVLLPSDRCDWEVELVVVVGRTAEHVAEADAWDHVAGLTVGQDVSERRVQFRKPGPNLAMAKSFPTFGPIGPTIVTPDELPDRDALRIRCAINDEPMQDGNTSALIFGVPRLIASLSSTVRLLPGDVIFTGTPAGVGSSRDPRRYLRPGDVITSEIEGIGRMRNVCRSADAVKEAG
jgi:2,4-diketo-3-deoxy-L-fuconate hydrolase